MNNIKRSNVHRARAPSAFVPSLAVVSSSASSFARSTCARTIRSTRFALPPSRRSKTFVTACTSLNDDADGGIGANNDEIPSSLPRTPLTSPYSAAESIDTPSQQSAPDTPRDTPCISTAVSSAPTLSEALADAASRSLSKLSAGGPPHLAVVHVSARYAASSSVGSSGRHSIDTVVPRLRGLLPSRTHIVGCTVDGVIGTDASMKTVEIERAPAISITLLRLPDVKLTPFHITIDELPSPDDLQGAWHSAVFGAGYKSKAKAINDARAFLIFSDPAASSRGELDRVLEGFDYAFPNAVVVGGLASAATTFADGHMICTLPKDILNLKDATGLHDSGIVGIALSGDVELDCLVSQGCRRIGAEFEVKQIDNLARSSSSGSTNITQLQPTNRTKNAYASPATDELQAIISYATSNEKRLLQNHLYLGVLNDDDGDSVVIKNVINVDFVDGVISVAANDIRLGQRVAFYVLENESMLHNLDENARKYKRGELTHSLVGYSNPPFGAVVVADVARTRDARFIPKENMETRFIADVAQGLPIGGAFMSGQIAPRDGYGQQKRTSRSVLHTAANLVVLWRRRNDIDPSSSRDEDEEGGKSESEKQSS